MRVSTIRFWILLAIVTAIVLGGFVKQASAESNHFEPCQTAGQAYVSADPSGHYRCDGTFWYWVNEALPPDPSTGIIGEPWSADSDLQAMWGQCKLFWRVHEDIKATFVFMDQAYEPDPQRIADVSNVSLKHVEVRIYPLFATGIPHAQMMVICHEYGHALLVSHNNHPASIMYGLFNLQSYDPRNVSDEDRKAVKRIWGNSFILFDPSTNR